MAINKNHEFEELDGVKCGIVEKNAAPGRVDFLKKLLAYNGYTVITIPSPPPKTAPAAKPVEGEEVPPVPTPEPPSTFTVGVTDYTFNPVNAVYGRMLRTPDGHVVTPAYWHQQEKVSRDDIPYYEDLNAAN